MRLLSKDHIVNKYMNIALENEQVPFDYNGITIYNLKTLYDTVEKVIKSNAFDFQDILDDVINSVGDGNFHEFSSHMTKSGNPETIYYLYNYNYNENLDEVSNRTITF